MTIRANPKDISIVLSKSKSELIKHYLPSHYIPHNHMIIDTQLSYQISTSRISERASRRDLRSLYQNIVYHSNTLISFIVHILKFYLESINDERHTAQNIKSHIRQLINRVCSIAFYKTKSYQVLLPSPISCTALITIYA